MITRFKIFVYLMLLFCFQSCLQNHKNSLDTENLEIPDSLYSFFPQKDASGFTGSSYTETNARKKNSYEKTSVLIESYYIKAQLPSSKYAFNTLIKEYRENAKDSLTLIDENYFIIANSKELLNVYDTIFLKEKYQMSKYILPSFYGYTEFRHGKNQNDLAVCGLSKDYKILIMKSGRHFVLPEYKKYDWNILSSELKHGYTSGVAYRTSDVMIIFWSIAW